MFSKEDRPTRSYKGVSYMIIASRPPCWSTWSPVVSHDPVPVCFVSLLVLGPLQGQQWASMGSTGSVGCPRDADSQEPPPLLLNGGLRLSSKLWDQKICGIKKNKKIKTNQTVGSKIPGLPTFYPESQKDISFDNRRVLYSPDVASPRWLFHQGPFWCGSAFHV